MGGTTAIRRRRRGPPADGNEDKLRTSTLRSLRPCQLLGRSEGPRDGVQTVLRGVDSEIHPPPVTSTVTEAILSSKTGLGNPGNEEDLPTAGRFHGCGSDMVDQTGRGNQGNEEDLPWREQEPFQLCDNHENRIEKLPAYPSPSRKVNLITLPLLPCFTLEAQVGFYTGVRKLTLADEWTNISCRLRVKDGTALETALSLTSSVEEYLAGLPKNADALCRHDAQPNVRKRRFRRLCAYSCALSTISHEFLRGYDDVVTPVIKNGKGRREAEVEPSPPLPSSTTSLFTSRQALPSVTTLC